jgi:hypothetical protein
MLKDWAFAAGVSPAHDRDHLTINGLAGSQLLAVKPRPARSPREPDGLVADRWYDTLLVSHVHALNGMVELIQEPSA